MELYGTLEGMVTLRQMHAVSNHTRAASDHVNTSRGYLFTPTSDLRLGTGQLNLTSDTADCHFISPHVIYIIQTRIPYYETKCYFRPPLCILLGLNWAKQVQGTMR